MRSLLEVGNLFCKYDKHTVVKDISFSVKENEKLCILGPNGCGKTTILKAISGLMPSEGQILLEGTDLKQVKTKEVSKKIALMTQLSSVYFSYSVYDTVMLGRYVHMDKGLFKTTSKLDQDIVLDCLTKTGTADIKDKMITQLSGGQLQRVFLARLFAQDPQIILLDEPTNHLDLRYQLELVDQLNEWATAKNRCVVGVLHDINLALSFASKVLLLNNGKTVSYGKIEDFDLNLISDIYRTNVKSYMLNALEKWNC